MRAFWENPPVSPERSFEQVVIDKIRIKMENEMRKRDELEFLAFTKSLQEKDEPKTFCGFWSMIKKQGDVNQFPL